MGMPNGCESVSAVMALQYIGIPITPEEFVSNYLDMGNAPSGGIGPDPKDVYKRQIQKGAELLQPQTECGADFRAGRSSGIS